MQRRRITSKTRMNAISVFVLLMLSSAGILASQSFPGWPSQNGVYFSDQYRPDARADGDLAQYQVFQQQNRRIHRNGFRPLLNAANAGPYGMEAFSTPVSMIPMSNQLYPVTTYGKNLAYGQQQPYQQHGNSYGYQNGHRYWRSRSWWERFFDFMPGGW